ncbi:MAG: ATP-binding protein, partial [Acidimicrobiales bacterium]
MADLLERDEELRAIRAGLDAAQAGDGCCVVIEGPAGIGKSSLLAVARAEAVERGFRVLTAIGGELERELPHGVVRQLFATAVTNDARRDRDLAGAAKLARPVLGLDPSESSAHTSGESRLLEVLHGLHWLAVDLTTDAPLLLTIDDAHWCDGASLQFLVYLRRRLEGLSVLVLVASRPGEPGADERLLHLLSRDGRDALRPHGLSIKAATDWLRGCLAEAPHPEFTTAVHEATSGNPFLIGELITALVDDGVRPTREAATQVTAIGPDGVRRAVLRRLDALGDGAGALARAVAVLGSGAALEDAAALAELAPATAAALVDSLVRIQVLRDERQLSFAHPLVRAAIYLDVPVAARAWLHARAARILADRGADANAVAAHLLETDPTGDATVVELLRGGARRAGEQGAMDVAATYLRRAGAEPPTPAVSAAVFAELGEAELAAGRPDAAATALASAWAEVEDRDT